MEKYIFSEEDIKSIREKLSTIDRLVYMVDNLNDENENLPNELNESKEKCETSLICLEALIKARRKEK